MTFSELSNMFNRAFLHAFSKKKLLFVFVILACSGLFAVICKGIISYVNPWMATMLVFLPFCAGCALLFPAGITLIRLYHDEIKRREVSFLKVCMGSWKALTSSLYLIFPLILSYLLLWVFLGFFVFIRGMPVVGTIIEMLFAFVPYLLVLGFLVLGVLAISVLFFVSPLVALNEKDSYRMVPLVISRLKQNVLGNVVFFIVGTLPALIVTVFLLFTAFFVSMEYLPFKCIVQAILQWFFVMLPMALFLSPFVVFFFNFAAEAHVACKNHNR
ncbi:MAG: hypothetical protein P4L16_00470 [Chlamydiales bacterium]|nr:hypothetical protein [Chlamydiales bacterium]